MNYHFSFCISLGILEIIKNAMLLIIGFEYESILVAILSHLKKIFHFMEWFVVHSSCNSSLLSVVKLLSISLYIVFFISVFSLLFV